MLDKVEVRATRKLELRSGEGGDGYTLRGYASVFDAPYEVSDFLGDYTEVIRAGAFKRTLNAGADVRLLVNHDGVALARTKSGTLTLSEDETGLLCEARLDPASPLVQSVKSAMDRGDMDEMSFAFRATRQVWNEDYTNREIQEAQLFDVSVVTYPANPATSASLRGAAVARFGSDMWGRIESALRGGDPLPEEDREVLRSLVAPVVPAPEAPDLALLRQRAAALDL